MSSMAYSDPHFYKVGGTVGPDRPCYVPRAADEELLKWLLAGEYCLVLNARQTGKSSLMARTSHRLRSQGIQTVTLDLHQIGRPRSADWYYGVCKAVVRGLGLGLNIKGFWAERWRLSSEQRLSEFFEMILQQVDEPIVIFFDEIERTTVASGHNTDAFSTDAFFAAIRSLHNRRATEPVFKRLTFVLLGVATPQDLISDPDLTPFNLGVKIELTDFSREEARVLLGGLAVDGDAAEALLTRALHWTGGHPFLTQELLKEIAHNGLVDGVDGERLAAEQIPAMVDEQVQRCFLDPARQLDNLNLGDVPTRLRKAERRDKARRLLLYRKILHRKKLADDGLSEDLTELKLTGLVVAEHRCLRVRNRIYRQVFDDAWIRQILPFYNIWLLSRFAAFVAIILAFLSVLWVVINARQIREARDAPPEAAYRRLAMTVKSNYAARLYAGYWDRRSMDAELQRAQGEALLYRLKGLTLAFDPDRRTQAERLSGELDGLLSTHRDGQGRATLAISPDFSHWVTSDTESSSVWSQSPGIIGGRPIETSLESSISQAAFARDARILVTGNAGGEVKLWSLEGEGTVELAKTRSLLGQVLDVALSADGRLVAASDSNGTVRLWRLRDDRLDANRFGLLFSGAEISSMALSPDGTWLAVALPGEYFVRLYRAQDLARPYFRIAHDQPVSTVRFSDDGDWLITAGFVIKLWGISPSGPSVHPGFTLEGHSDEVTAVSMSSRDALVSGGADNTVRLWSLSGRESPVLPRNTFRVHNREVTAVAACGENLIASGGAGGQTSLLDANTRAVESSELLRSEHRVLELAIDASGRPAAIDAAGRLVRWTSRRPVVQADVFDAEEAVTCLHFSAGDRWLLAGGSGTGLRLWPFSGPSSAPITDDPNPVTCAAFSPDGSWLLAGDDQGDTHLWRLASEGAEHARVLASGSAAVQRLDVSPDGRWFAASHADGAVRVGRLDPRSKTVRTLPNRLGSILTLAFAAQGWLATGDVDGTLWLWRLDSETLLEAPSASAEVGSWVSALTFTPDGRHLVAGTAGAGASLWQVGPEGRLKPASDQHPFSALSRLSGERAIREILFDDDGARMILLTEDRLFVLTAGEDELTAVESHPWDHPFGPYRWIRDWFVAAHLDTSGKAVRLWTTEVRTTGGARFFPQQAFEKWQSRLALGIDGEGQPILRPGGLWPAEPLPEGVENCDRVW